MKNARDTTNTTISISLPMRLVQSLDRVREREGTTRSGYITEILRRTLGDKRWERIYRKGEQTRRHFDITSEEDIDRILRS